MDEWASGEALPFSVPWSLPSSGPAASPFAPGDVGEPGKGGRGGGRDIEDGRAVKSLDPPIRAPAVEGRGGSFECAPEERFSRLILRESSGDDFLCAASGDSEASTADPEANAGTDVEGATGEDGMAGDAVASDMAASDPRRPKRACQSLPEGLEMGDRIPGVPLSCRELLRLNHALDFFSGPRSLSLDVGVDKPFGNVCPFEGMGEDGMDGTPSCVW